MIQSNLNVEYVAVFYSYQLQDYSFKYFDSRENALSFLKEHNPCRVFKIEAELKI